jgi:hypothetical protein
VHRRGVSGRRVAVIAAVAAALATACGRERESGSHSADSRCAAPLVVRADGVGPVLFGDSLAPAVAPPCVVGETSVLFAGIRGPGWLMRSGGTTVGVLALGGRVSHVVVLDSLVPGPGGIRVGSTIADVRRVHGRVCALHGEGRVTVGPAAAPELRFEVAGPGLRPPGDTVVVDTLASLVPDGARVAAMLVHDGRRFAGPDADLCAVGARRAGRPR